VIDLTASGLPEGTKFAAGDLARLKHEAFPLL